MGMFLDISRPEFFQLFEFPRFKDLNYWTSGPKCFNWSFWTFETNLVVNGKFGTFSGQSSQEVRNSGLSVWSLQTKTILRFGVE